MTTYTAIYCPLEICAGEGCPFNHASRSSSASSVNGYFTSLPNQKIELERPTLCTRLSSFSTDSTLSSISELSTWDSPSPTFTRHFLFGNWVEANPMQLFAPRGSSISIDDVFSPKAAVFPGGPTRSLEDTLDPFADFSDAHGDVSSNSYSRLSSTASCNSDLSDDEILHRWYINNWTERYHAASPEEQKIMLGDDIFANIERLEPELADKITCLLVATIENDDLLDLTTDRAGLIVEVEGAKQYILDNPEVMDSPRSYWFFENDPEDEDAQDDDTNSAIVEAQATSTHYMTWLMSIIAEAATGISCADKRETIVTLYPEIFTKVSNNSTFDSQSLPAPPALPMTTSSASRSSVSQHSRNSSIYSEYFEMEEDYADFEALPVEQDQTFDEWHMSMYGMNHDQARRLSYVSVWSDDSEVEDECMYCAQNHFVHEHACSASPEKSLSQEEVFF